MWIIELWAVPCTVQMVTKRVKDDKNGEKLYHFQKFPSDVDDIWISKVDVVGFEMMPVDFVEWQEY